MSHAHAHCRLEHHKTVLLSFLLVSASSWNSEKMFKFLVAVIIGGLLNTSVLLAQNLAYELVIHSRGNNGLFVNNIQLACRIRNDSTFDSQAIYWLNATQVVNGDRWTGDFGLSGISFALTRDTEGTYTCGRMDGNTVTRSDPETLIGEQSKFVRQ